MHFNDGEVVSMNLVASMMNLVFLVELCRWFEFVELVVRMMKMDDVVVHMWNVAHVVVEPRMMVKHANVNASVSARASVMIVVVHTMMMELMEELHSSMMELIVGLHSSMMELVELKK